MLGIRPQIWLLAGVACAGVVALALGMLPSPGGRVQSVSPPSGPAPPASREAQAWPPASPGVAAHEAATALSDPASVAGAGPLTAAARMRAGDERVEEAALPDAADTPERQKTREQIELERRIRDEARKRGLQLPPEVREVIDTLEPLPGESETDFADRLRDLETEAMTDELLVDWILARKYRSELYRWGEPTSQHRPEIQGQVAAMTAEHKSRLIGPILDAGPFEIRPRFIPPEWALPYEGPGAEPPPPNYVWAPPELYEPGSLLR